MVRPAFVTALVLLAATGFAVAPQSSAARGQSGGGGPGIGEASPNELRQENERLRQRISELDAQLAEARRRIARLEESIRTMRGGGAPAAIPPPGPADGVEPGDAPKDPYAGPDALFQVLRSQFIREIGERPIENTADLDRYLRDARKWVSLAAQQHRKPVEWVVRVVDAGPAANAQGPVPNSGEVMVEIVEPVTGAPVGSAFQVTLERRELARLREETKAPLWTLSGVLAAAPVVNYPPDAQPPVFNAPKAIGEHVEFGFTFTLKSLAPYTPPTTPKN